MLKVLLITLIAYSHWRSNHLCPLPFHWLPGCCRCCPGTKCLHLSLWMYYFLKLIHLYKNVTNKTFISQHFLIILSRNVFWSALYFPQNVLAVANYLYIKAISRRQSWILSFFSDLWSTSVVLWFKGLRWKDSSSAYFSLTVRFRPVSLSKCF